MATILFAGSSSSKAEHVPGAHTGDTDMAGYADCHRQGKTQTAKSSYSFSAGTDRSLLAKARTHLLIPQVPAWPLYLLGIPLPRSQTLFPASWSPAPWLVQLDGCWQRHALTHLSHWHSAFASSPGYQHKPLPACLLASPAWSWLANTHARSMHTRIREDTDTRRFPAPASSQARRL